MKYFRSVCVLAAVCTFVSCDAPRTNPLDPESSDYKYSTITGTVSAQSNQLPMQGVKVSWKNQNTNLVVQTGTDGSYSINQIDKNDGWLYFEKDAFWKDSMFVQFNGAKNVLVNRQLNAMPYSDFNNLYTREENLLPAIKNDTLVVRASIKDADGDIDSVMIQNKEINFYKKLPYDATTKYYQAKLITADLNISSLLEVQGTSFDFVAIDKSNRKLTVGTKILTRIITQEIIIKSPANGVSLPTSNTIVFEWQQFDPHFDFTYTLQIYVDIFGDDSTPPIFERRLISKNDVSFSLSKVFNPGSYYWVIWAIDSFGNGTKSKRGSFLIQ